MQQEITLEVTPSLGMNTAVNVAEIPKGAQRRAKNALMREINTLSKRDGSVPVTTVALSTIKHLTEYRFNNSVAVGIAPVLSSVGNAASTLPAATYYVRYTYVTDVGETQASAEASVVVPPAVVNPTVAPTLGQSADAGETLPDTTYFVAYTWKNAVGETMVSTESSLLITAGNRLNITIPALPSGATSLSVYAGTTTGILKFQYNTASLVTFINTPLTAIQAPPVANTCIVANLRIVTPAIPVHANSINLYISTTTNTETKQINTTSLTYNQIVALVAGVAYPTTNTTDFSAELLASAGTSLYAYYNGELRSVTMTNTLASSDIYTLGFKNLALTSILFITDGGVVKFYNGSAVANITPAGDDAGPAPANYLATLNTLLPKYCWVFRGHLFISIGDDSAWHSKVYEYDYFPTTFTTRYVRNNDYITGCGVPFGDVCLLPMRRGWGVTFYDSAVSTLMTGNQFLNTISGNIAPRGIAKLTFPDGTQTVAYLSDDGVYEVYDTNINDSSGTGSRNYATRPLMKDKIDFTAIGFTEAEKTAAHMEFDSVSNLLKLKIARSTTYYIYIMDVRNREWYYWTLPAQVLPSVRYNNISYFAGTTGLLHKFSDTLYTDYDTSLQTTGTIVDFDVYSGLISFEFSGDASYLHYYLCEAKQWSVKSTLDVEIVYSADVLILTTALRNEVFVWGVSAWSEAEWANLFYTEIINNAKRNPVHKKAKYFQRRFRNPRNEPVTILREKFIGTLSGRL